MAVEIIAGIHHPVFFHPLGDAGTNIAVKDNTTGAARNPAASEATLQGIKTLQQVPSTLETMAAAQKQSQTPKAKDIDNLGRRVDILAYARADYLIYLTAAAAVYSIL